MGKNKKSKLNHRLMKQLTMSADVTEEEIEELFYDLKYIFENSFDAPIESAIKRGCAYIEQIDQLPN